MLRGWIRQPQVWVLIGMLIFSGYFCTVSVFRHQNLQTSQFDLGNMDQVVWNTVHGNFFQMTSPVNAVHELRSAVHADFLLLAYVPFYLLWQDPRMLMIVQVLAVATGAMPLFWIGKKMLPQRIAALFALAYLLYPSLQWSVVFDVHAVVLATPLLLWAWWAFQERRWWVYSLTLFAAVLAKEEVGLTVALLGLYLAWKHRPRWIGMTTAVAGIIWTALMLGVVIPASRHAPGHFALSYYADYGQSYGQIGLHLLRYPWTLIQPFIALDGLGYQFILLAPLALLSLFSIPILLIAYPEVAINLLSSYPEQHTMFYQYTAVITPFIFVSAVHGWARLSGWLDHRAYLSAAIGSTVIAAFLTSIYAWSPLPGTHHHADAIKPFVASLYSRDIQHIETMVKPADRLATLNNIAPHFTQRAYEWAFPHALDQADGVVLLAIPPYDNWELSITELRQRITEMQTDPQWQLAYHDRDVYYFRRVRAATKSD